MCNVSGAWNIDCLHMHIVKITLMFLDCSALHIGRQL